MTVLPTPTCWLLPVRGKGPPPQPTGPPRPESSRRPRTGPGLPTPGIGQEVHPAATSGGRHAQAQQEPLPRTRPGRSPAPRKPQFQAGGEVPVPTNGGMGHDGRHGHGVMWSRRPRADTRPLPLAGVPPTADEKAESRFSYEGKPPAPAAGVARGRGLGRGVGLGRKNEPSPDGSPRFTHQPAAGQQPSGGLVGPVQVEVLEGIDMLVIKGDRKDVDSVSRMIEEVERLSVEKEEAKPDYTIAKPVWTTRSPRHRAIRPHRRKRLPLRRR